MPDLGLLTIARKKWINLIAGSGMNYNALVTIPLLLASLCLAQSPKLVLPSLMAALEKD